LSNSTDTNPTPTPPAPSIPRTPGEPRIIALMNQKGGVGKTTTAVNLGAALSRQGKRVLMIDLDPQAHTTLHLGIDPDSIDASVYTLLTDPTLDARTIARRVSENMIALPAEVNLAGVESELAAMAASGSAQHILRDKCAALLKNGLDGDGSGSATASAFDYVLIDCPPSLGLLTVNALALAREVFVPMQPHFLALQGLSKLLETVNLVSQGVNPQLQVTGIILCMYESQTLLAAEVLADLNAFLDAGRSMAVPWRGARVLTPNIRRNIKLAEVPSFGKTIFEYAPGCAGAQDYAALAKSVEAM